MLYGVYDYMEGVQREAPKNGKHGAGMGLRSELAGGTTERILRERIGE